MWIDWLDLPKLISLRTRNSIDFTSDTFKYPRHIILESDSHPLWMMLRHAQSHRCVSFFIGIRLQGWRHNHRKYSLHHSLTNRHRSSLSTRIIRVLHEHSSWFWQGDGLSGWKWCLSICECDFIWLECVSEFGDADNWWLQFLFCFIGVEEYSHSQWVMTRHAFAQITRHWWICIRVVFPCCVWEWLIVMWVID